MLSEEKQFLISTPIPSSLIIGSEYCNFTSPTAKNLVLAFSDRIEVYEWGGNTLTKELKFLPGCNLAYIKCIKNKKNESDLIFVINSEFEFSIFGYNNGEIYFVMKGGIVSTYKRIREQGIQIAVCPKQGKIAITGMDQNLYVIDRFERTDRKNAEFIKGPLDVVDMSFIDYSKFKSETRIAMLVHYETCLYYEVFELDYRTCSLRNVLTIKDIPIHCTKLYCPQIYNDGTTFILGAVCIYIVRGGNFSEKKLTVNNLERIELDIVIDNSIISIAPFTENPSKFAFCDRAGILFSAEILTNDIIIEKIGNINPTAFLNHLENNIFFGASMIKDSILFSIDINNENPEMTNINILDSIPYYGPITDMCMVNEDEQIMGICGGDGKNGFLSLIKHSPTFRCAWEFVAVGLHRFYVIPNDNQYNICFASTLNTTITFVLCTKTGERMEISFPGFNYDSRTLFVNYHAITNTYIQVTDESVSITNLSDKIFKNFQLLNEEDLTSISTNNNGIFIVANGNSIYVYNLNDTKNLFMGEHKFEKKITSIDMLKATGFKALAFFVTVFEFTSNIYMFKVSYNNGINVELIGESNIENVGIINDIKWYCGNNDEDSDCIIACDFSGNAYFIDFDVQNGFKPNYLLLNVGDGALETFECSVKGQRSIFFSCENSGFAPWRKWETDIPKLNINTSLQAYSYFDNNISYIVHIENNTAKVSYLTDEKEISYDKLEIDYDLTRFAYDQKNNVLLSIAIKECEADYFEAAVHDFDLPKPNYGPKIRFPCYELSSNNVKKEIAEEIKNATTEDSYILLVSLDHMKIEAMYKLPPFEVALCIKPITIPSHLGSFFVVGTAVEKFELSQPEIIDGRLLLIEVKGDYQKTIEIRAEKSVKSPVFSIATNEDQVIATMLNSVRVFKCTIDDFKLKQSKYEFLRANRIEMYGEKAIVGDAMRSVSILSIKKDSADIYSRLTDSRGLTAIHIFDDDCYIRCIENCIHILTECQTEEFRSLQISKMLYIGMQVNKIIHGHIGKVDLSKYPGIGNCLTMATLEGSLITLFEIDTKMYNFLKIIEGKIYDRLPRFFESHEPSEILKIKGKNQFVNTDYFKYFMTLSTESRKDILKLEGIPPYPCTNEVIHRYETLENIVSLWSQLF
ncbi:DNA damage-binding protein 1 [Strongyloides ratti]|uniref:DNA damage-binding protein 1 n=1 Tax=Strongyloides ratti TaxID=34506 RepID=A0A090LD92_STRRB|nr:DNA damage-binding protein 1 [Strongyloides ratti]CEF67697.1 DNA damage-binding protein 1 [Strongyloides ratti]